MATNRAWQGSSHFRLEQLAQGVYAAIHVAGGAAICNAGIVDLGDRTLVYDTFMSPQAAADLRAAAEALTGRPVRYVVNSHWHSDHTWGNQVFGPGTEIIASTETRRIFAATRGEEDYDGLLATAEAKLESMRARLQAATEPGQRDELALWVDNYKAVVLAKPILKVRVPNLTFGERLAFHGAERDAELIAFSGGHTASDVVLLLPREGIAFLSDLLFVECHPYLGDGDPDGLLSILQTITALGLRTVVPGHGPVGSAESVALLGRYVLTLDRLAREAVERGEAEAALAAAPIPAPFNAWGIASFWAANLRFLYQHRLA